MQLRLLLDANLSWHSVAILKNQNRKLIESVLINRKEQIIKFAESSEYGVLELI